MTDIFIVDEHGRFAVGKAPTTKFEESIGCMEASEDAFWTWELDFTASAKELSAPFDNVVYAGTSMLNALITRSGERLGLIITKGFERTLLQGRAKDAIAGYMLEDVVHMTYREHKEPSIPLRRIRGVTNGSTHSGVW